MKKVLLFNRRVGLGEELVVNGDFSQGDTGWTLGVGWSIANGVATLVGDGSLQPLTQDSLSLSSSKTYICSYEVISYTNGAMSFSFNNSPLPVSAGVHSVIIEESSGVMGFKRYGPVNGGVLNISIDNISVREIL